VPRIDGDDREIAARRDESRFAELLEEVAQECSSDPPLLEPLWRAAQAKSTEHWGVVPTNPPPLAAPTRQENHMAKNPRRPHEPVQEEEIAESTESKRSATGMMFKAKIRLDSIERAHRALDALPQHKPDELTKAQAIQMLLDDIRATQSKGYSLDAIGKMLCEAGVPITTGALRAYVSAASGAGAKKKRRLVKAGADTKSGAVPRGPNGNPKDGTAQSAASRGTPESAKPAQNLDLGWEPTTRSSNGSATTGGPAAREDGEDL
jgi:hypothetical protein